MLLDIGRYQACRGIRGHSNLGATVGKKLGEKRQFSVVFLLDVAVPITLAKLDIKCTTTSLTSVGRGSQILALGSIGLLANCSFKNPVCHITLSRFVKGHPSFPLFPVRLAAEPPRPFSERPRLPSP